jgi:hypothetical protein
MNDISKWPSTFRLYKPQIRTSPVSATEEPPFTGVHTRMLLQLSIYTYFSVKLRFFANNMICKVKKKRKSYPCNRPWRPMGLSEVEAPIFSRQSAHRWRWGCQSYAPVTFYPQEDSWYSFLLEAASTPGPVWLEGLGQIGNRTRDLPACSIVPQPTMLSRATIMIRTKTVITFFSNSS